RVCLSARALRRHADAGFDCPRLGHRSRPLAARRTFRGTRRDHPDGAQRRLAAALGSAPDDCRVRHPQRLRIGLSLDADRGNDPTAGTDRCRFDDRAAATARPRVACIPDLRSDLRDGVGRARTSNGRGIAMSAGRSLRLWRVAAPLAVGVVFLCVWEIVVRVSGVPRYILPSPHEIAVSLWTDGPSLLGSLLVTLRVTLAALAAATVLGGGIAVLFSLSRI